VSLSLLRSTPLLLVTMCPAFLSRIKDLEVFLIRNRLSPHLFSKMITVKVNFVGSIDTNRSPPVLFRLRKATRYPTHPNTQCFCDIGSIFNRFSQSYVLFFEPSAVSVMENVGKAVFELAPMHPS